MSDSAKRQISPFPFAIVHQSNYMWVHLYCILILTLEQEGEGFKEIRQYKGDNAFHSHENYFLHVVL